MSTKNFVSYGDAETLFTGVGSELSSLKSGLTNVQDDFTDVIGWNRNPNLIEFEQGTYNGTHGAKATATDRIRSSSIYLLKAGTYTLSAGTTASGQTMNINYSYWSTGSTAGDNTRTYDSPWLSSPTTITLSADTYVAIICKYASGNTMDVADCYIQLESGSTATAFEPCHTVIGEAVQLNTNDLTTPSRTKNLGVTIPTASISGIDFTAQNDGGLKAEGTATAFTYTESIFTLKAGSYILSKGDNADGGRITVSVRKNQDDTVIASVSDFTEEPFTLDSDTVVKFRASILSGKTVNSTIYPMIRLASVSDPTFAPYIPSVESRIEAVESDLTNKEPLGGATTGNKSFKVGGNLELRTDAEGGNINIVSSNNVQFEIDAYTDVLRIWSDKSGSYKFLTWNGNEDININSIVTYSETPVKIGNWLGHDLYRKVIDIGALPDSLNKRVASWLTNERVVNIYGYAINGNNTWTIPLPFISANETIDRCELAYDGDNHAVSVTTNTNLSAFSGIVVVEYYTVNS